MGLTSFLVIFLLKHVIVTHSLVVTPSSIPEPEGDSEVHFFCKESNTDYAIGISWEDPRGNFYTPGSPSGAGADPRIVAEGSRLSISDLVREDSGDYRCFRVSAPSDYAVGTLLVYAPPIILNPMPVQEIHHRETSLIRCGIDRGYPLAAIHWLHIEYNNETGEQRLTEITNDSDPRFTIVEDGLRIENVQLSDAGVYRCYVYNDYGTEVLDIQAAFRALPLFIGADVELEVVQPLGESISLDCAAAGAPLPNYTWSVPPNSQIAQGPLFDGPILDVQLSDPSDAGQYTCTVTNGVGTINRVFTLNVAIAPLPTIGYHDSNVSLGKPAMLGCHVNAHPNPSFEWVRDKPRQPLPETSWVSEQGNEVAMSTLMYAFEMTDLNEDCSLVVMCIATNEYGRSEQYFTIHLNNSVMESCHSKYTTTAHTPISHPTAVVVGDADLNPQGQESSSGSDGGGSTFVIWVSVFTVAMMCIVIGVTILLVYFLKHFNSKRRSAKLQQQSKGTPSQLESGTSTKPNINVIPAATSPLPRALDSDISLSSRSFSKSQISSTFCTACGQIHLSQSPCLASPYLMPHPSQSVQGISPPLSQPSKLNGTDDTYSRLNHVHSQHSVSSSGSPQLPFRLSSSSSAASNSPLLLNTQSSSELEDSLNSSVFSDNFQVDPRQQIITCRQWSSSSTEHSATPRGLRFGDPRPDELYANPAYERTVRKFRVSPPTSDDNQPHIYETVS